MTQMFADELRLEDAALQRRTIVGDEDGHWLAARVKELHRLNGTIRSGQRRAYRFLPDDAEVLLDAVGPDSVIEMPAGSSIRRTAGNGYRNWVFRVDNGMVGRANEYFDLAYRTIAPGAHMLYLKQHCCGSSSSS